jgi:uncharacterized protein
MGMREGKFTRRSLLISSSLLIPGIRLLHRFAWASNSQLGYPVRPVPFTEVDIDDDFWAPRMEVNRNVSIWHCFEKMKRFDAFGASKLVEAAAYMIAKHPDPRLEEYTDGVIDKIIAGVESRLADPDKAVRVPGHFLEAAVAYYAATGKRKMLDVALADANTIDANFGSGKKTYISEHEGQKIGLIQLYLHTGDARYLNLAKFFLDERGKEDYHRTGEYAIDRTYAQDHEPVVAQKEAVGHCVRAMFLYIPLTDIAALTGRSEYADASQAIWEDMVYRKLYLTGSIGSIRFHEQFGAAYELPNLSGWNETCASYGNIVWNHRMFLLHQDAKYIDVMERVLYNGFADGVSLKGDRFFYQNPLKSFGNYERFDWIDVPCCPPNVVRLTASLGSYIYACSGDSIYVNLFVACRATIKFQNNNTVQLVQRTHYPWDGSITLEVNPEREEPFAVQVRIPGWARNEVLPGDLYRYTDHHHEMPTLTVNGHPHEIAVERGYVRIKRKWKKNDVIKLTLPMPVRQVQANDSALENRNMVALQRGPLVYCAEWPDNNGQALNLFVPDDAVFKAEWRSDLLSGVEVITGNVQALERKQQGGTVEARPHTLVAIPYCTWSNRGMGEMAVWLARSPKQSWLSPVPADPIAAVTSSGGVEKKWTGYNDQNDDIRALYDGKDPVSSADESYLYFRMRPDPETPGWVEYEFKAPTSISAAKVYWFDDRRFCRLPASWRVLYKEGSQWKPVENLSPYIVTKDEFNVMDFKPVTTSAVRIEVEPQTKLYKAGEIGPPAANFVHEDIHWREFGLLEWRVS